MRGLEDSVVSRGDDRARPAAFLTALVRIAANSRRAGTGPSSEMSPWPQTHTTRTDSPSLVAILIIEAVPVDAPSQKATRWVATRAICWLRITPAWLRP